VVVGLDPGPPAVVRTPPPQDYEKTVTNYLAFARRSFRSHALAALESLTGSRDEFRREAREIFGLEIE